MLQAFSGGNSMAMVLRKLENIYPAEKCQSTIDPSKDYSKIQTSLELYTVLRQYYYPYPKESSRVKSINLYTLFNVQPTKIFILQHLDFELPTLKNLCQEQP